VGQRPMNTYAINAGNLQPRVIRPTLVKRPNYSNAPRAYVPPAPVEVAGCEKPVFYFWTKTWHNVCGRKRAIFIREDAVEKALRLSPRFKKRGKGILAAYQCPFCDWWHLGHQPKTKKSETR
jgi:hypothetical protein